MKSDQFRLPGKKTLQPSDTVIEMVIVDATEQPIERSKKSSVDITAAKRNDKHRRLKGSSINVPWKSSPQHLAMVAPMIFVCSKRAIQAWLKAFSV